MLTERELFISLFLEDYSMGNFSPYYSLIWKNFYALSRALSTFVDNARLKLMRTGRQSVMSLKWVTRVTLKHPGRVARPADCRLWRSKSAGLHNLTFYTNLLLYIEGWYTLINLLFSLSFQFNLFDLKK